MTREHLLFVTIHYFHYALLAQILTVLVLMLQGMREDVHRLLRRWLSRSVRSSVVSTD